MQYELYIKYDKKGGNSMFLNPVLWVAISIDFVSQSDLGGGEGALTYI